MKKMRWIICVFRHHDPRPVASVSFIPIVPGVEMQAVRNSVCKRCGRMLKGGSGS